MTITICVTSDLHGRLDRFEQIADKIKALQPDILIDNGDFLQGSLTSYYYEYVNYGLHPMIPIANELGYDVGIFGNHEFNYPPEHVASVREACNFPWIASNIGGFSKPYIIKEVRGQRVAIIGVTTHFTPLWDEQGFTKDLYFSDAYEAARHWVQHVKQQENPHTIILCYHGGFTKDPVYGYNFSHPTGENQANEMLNIPDVDCFITGHQHLELATLVDGKPVVQPGANGQCFAHITLGENPCAELHYTENVPTTYPPVVAAWLQQKIGETSIDFTYEGLLQSRLNKQPFVDFMHDVQLKATGADISAVELFYHETGGFKGEITHQHVLDNMCRPNLLTVLALSGADIRAALEQCASVFALKDGEVDFSYNVFTDTPQPYLYDFWGGIDYTFAIHQPIGQRVTQLLYKGQPIEDDQIYKVVMNSYRATGAEFEMFKNKPVLATTPNIIPEIIFQHIRKNSPLQLTPHGRFQLEK